MPSPRLSSKPAQTKPAKPQSEAESAAQAGLSHRRVTLSDIARVVGLSHVSVSLALRDSPRISAEAKRRIRETADKLGYQPDPMLSALTRYRFQGQAQPVKASLAWLNLRSSSADLRRFKEFDAYWRGAQEVASRCGFNLEEFIPSPQLSLARIQQILLARGILGILLPPSPRPNILNGKSLSWERFSIVGFGHSHMPDLPVHIVTTDQVAASLTSLRSIRALGYQRIGYVTRASSLHYTRFLEGVLRAQAELSPRLRLQPCVFDDADPRVGERQVMEWFRSKKPDAIFTEFGGLRDLLEKQGVKVPSEVALASTSVLDGNVNAGINQNSVEIGRVALETLVSLISSNHRGIPAIQRQVLVEGAWVDGSSMPARFHA